MEWGLTVFGMAKNNNIKKLRGKQLRDIVSILVFPVLLWTLVFLQSFTLFLFPAVPISPTAGSSISDEIYPGYRRINAETGRKVNGSIHFIKNSIYNFTQQRLDVSGIGKDAVLAFYLEVAENSTTTINITHNGDHYYPIHVTSYIRPSNGASTIDFTANKTTQTTSNALSYILNPGASLNSTVIIKLKEPPGDVIYHYLIIIEALTQADSVEAWMFYSLHIINVGKFDGFGITLPIGSILYSLVFIGVLIVIRRKKTHKLPLNNV